MLIFDNNKNVIYLNVNNGMLYNIGMMEFMVIFNKGVINYWGVGVVFINDGMVNVIIVVLVYVGGGVGSVLEKYVFFWNQLNGVINYDVDNGCVVDFFVYNNYVVVNDGIMNISGNNVYGMYGGKNV